MTDEANSVPASEAQEIRDALAAMGLAASSDALRIERLSGGVSCDVFRIGIGERTLCLKRALPKLRVEAEWRAPAERSATEAAWLKLAERIVPGHVPAILGEDRARHMFAMEFFPPEQYPVWKAQLAHGHIEPAFAAHVGATIVRVHAAMTGRPGIAAAFANDAQFRALRLDPFLLHVAAKHEDIGAHLHTLAVSIASARIALMHGDVSPKNILCGGDGPVFLDAETACYGDPAFDLAFCLNHLLLKCVWHPEWHEGYLQCFTHLRSAYLAGVDWEEPQGVEQRTARLLPALLLARIDGKSPVEYLTETRKKDFVRAEAKLLMARDAGNLPDIASHWADAVSRDFP